MAKPNGSRSRSAEDFGDLGVVRFRVGAEDGRGVDGQRAVDVDLEVGRQVAPLDQVVEPVDQLLGAADGERRAQ
jgi:hypothetical protein